MRMPYSAPNIVTPTQATAIVDAIVAQEGGVTSHLSLRALLLELRTSGGNIRIRLD